MIWGGEFGRTPMSESGNGRDHNPYGFTMWMAGGGVKGGVTYGATDEIGLYAVEEQGPRPRPPRHDPALLRPRPRAADVPAQRPRRTADGQRRAGDSGSAKLNVSHGQCTLTPALSRRERGEDLTSCALDLRWRASRLLGM